MTYKDKASYDSKPPCLPVATSLGRRPIECLIFIGYFPQKSPIISCSFAKNDPQLKASYGSSPPCRPVATSLGRRPVGCLIFIGYFPQKSPIISGSFAKNNLQLEASYGSLPPCTLVGISLGGRYAISRLYIVRLHDYEIHYKMIMSCDVTCL